MAVEKLCRRSVEFRSSGKTSDGRTLEGLAAPFNQETEIGGLFFRFMEQISPGAFTKTLQGRVSKIKMQFDHGRDLRTGHVPIGVFEEIREDAEGLFVRGRLFQNDAVEPIREAIAGGAIDGMSILMRVIRDEWRDDKGRLLVDDDEIEKLLWSADDDDPRVPLHRTIKEVQLLEAGPVVYPAYEQTSVGVRNVAPQSIPIDHARRILEELK